jgi:hypothetical protein
MSVELEDSGVQFLPSVQRGPDESFRYMKRRRVDRRDRNGDPLDGVVNLFTVAVVLAVGLLFAALAGTGLSDILTSDGVTIVTDPGGEEVQVIVKDGDRIERLDVQDGVPASGFGTLVGEFYRLADGTTVYVPAGGQAPSAPGTTAPGTTAPGTTAPGTTAPGATAAPTVTPTATPQSSIAPAPTAPPMPAPNEDGVSDGSIPLEPPSKKSGV